MYATPHPVDADRTPGPGWYRMGGKRVLDLAGVALLAPVALPLVALLALPTALWGGGAPLFTQSRVGRGGRPFRMWKLRTMVPGADAALERHLRADPAARREWDLYQKLRHDPRVTPVGAVLRRFSLDELPQLWNVLRGDMSLVGPRPMLASQQGLYPDRAYYRLRPGITGAWQVSDRGRGTFADRARHDAAYERALGLRTDAAILLATTGAVLRATGT
ncbi:sugar transferase [Jannaschia sp. W003]|uniref:sugar transferase n=1 Tax=Jannaschia sp. W003 TaxID=2867012 RepID=UPI0021A6C0CD|nr:sugar transferase [Jannaschia sp. W003]UWQ21846.1 sugar transferase [Jannaschia sp. W003]